MAAKRCSLHGIDYPLNYNMCLVPGCQERQLSYFSNVEPDPDYKEMVEYFSDQFEDNDVDSFVSKEPVRIINESVVHLGEAAIPDCLGAIKDYADKLWIPHEDLITSGYLFLEDFQVVMIRGKFYELQAHVGRASLTHGLTGGAWWIEEIDPDKFPCPDHIPEEVMNDGEDKEESA